MNALAAGSMQDADSTKERIVNAVLEISLKEGIKKITIRKIAALAKVNVAAVNYHFGSKANIVGHALQFLFDKASTMLEPLGLPDSMLKPENEEMTKSVAERITRFLHAFSELIYEHHELYLNVILQMFGGEHPIQGVLQEFIRSNAALPLKAALSLLFPERSEEEIRFTVPRLIGAIFFPLLAKDSIMQIIGIDITNPETRRKYIDAVARSVLERHAP